MDIHISDAVIKKALQNPDFISMDEYNEIAKAYQDIQAIWEIVHNY